jgi:hypothetical protein
MKFIKSLYNALTLTSAIVLQTSISNASTGVIDVTGGKVATDSGANTIHIKPNDILIKKGNGTLKIVNAQDSKTVNDIPFLGIEDIILPKISFKEPS